MNAPLPKNVMSQPLEHMQLQVQAIRLEAQGICSFELTNPDGHALPSFEAGAHVDVHLAGGLVRSYSLAGDPRDSRKWVLGVLREPKSQGGSRAMHDKVRVGDVLTVGPVRNAFPMATHATHTILLAGGIGITPLKSMAHVLAAKGASFELHYCARGTKNIAFADALRAVVPAERLHFHLDGGDPAKGLDIKALLQQPAADTHVYYCGPGGFMKACAEASAHWPEGMVHSEHFKAPEPVPSDMPDGAFEVRLVRSRETIQVMPDQTIVRAIELTGRRVPTSCLSGLCGACKVDYVDGEVDHRDYILNDEEKTRCLTVCVSRAKSKTLSLDI
jgi:vanillate O-demethylase ferredoxin subunit